MKKGLSIVFYPLLWLLGAFSILGGNSASMSDLILFGKDIAQEPGYDGQAIYDQIERRNG
ncbi:hypothetical protein [Paenibacillus silvae]|uniref:Uncharacterized protein n=1 Tax=Paenibacillus silvae TaxID=1325358 RepID=A0A2W6NC31_9BACL|nr:MULTISPECIES: hypothetical protein [Paenibacillus]MCK6075538.1 hypothetical protein [Paenibacillus silvae]MCK6149925.1 hypothetical protein [Paenibacillus silvae]MCK6268223.1 hypothetical protein [Paenibacillus silvae]PZT53567.1 hypothetical protein DN757_21485 [Paenibacillus silvae]GGH44537.1 hypothetical protein GCM10008014_05970 [Paenibacillus silvae]